MLKLLNWSVKNFKQEQLVIKKLNLSFYDGQVVAIIGSSGVGKTTFLNSLALNTEVNGGDIYFDSKKIEFNKKSVLKKYRKNIGYISQKNSLIEDISVFDNLKYVLSDKNNFLFSFLNIITKKQKERIYQVLLDLGILDKVFYKIKDLSGGESQRVEVAKILLKKPKIILADEPISNLDALNSSYVISCFNKIAKENFSIVIINLHSLDQLKNNIDRVIGLKESKVLFDKQPSEITEQDLRLLYEK